MKLTLKFLCLVLVLSFSAFAQTEKGIELYNRGEYENSIRALQQVLKQDKNNSQALFYLGSAYFKTNKIKEAGKTFERAVKINPNDSQLQVGLAYFYVFRNKLIDAQRTAQKAVELNRQNPEAHYILGLVAFRNGSYSSAYSRAEAAIKLSPEFANAYLLKSEALTASVSQTAGAVTKSPNQRGELLIEALENLEKYLSLIPNEKEDRFQRETLESLKFFAEYYTKPENMTRTDFTVAPPTSDSSITPLKIITKPRASYTDNARQAGVSGVVRMAVGFMADGKVKHVIIFSGLGYGLNEQAVRAARGIKFEPQKKDGVPVSVVKIIEYNFTLY